MSIIKPVVVPMQAGLGTIQHPSKLHVFLLTSESMSLERNHPGPTGRNHPVSASRDDGESFIVLPYCKSSDSEAASTNLAFPLGAAGISLAADWRVIGGTLVTLRVRLTADQAKSCLWSGRLACIWASECFRSSTVQCSSGFQVQ